jgi:hypothetical protein
MAHWRAASPGQMNEMQKRTRPGWDRQFTDAEALAFAKLVAPRAPRGEGASGELEQHWQYQLSQADIGNLYAGVPKEQLPTLPKIPPAWLEDITGDTTEWYAPGKPGYNDTLADFTPEQRARAYLAEMTTTGFHVYEGLSQSGYPPFWRARLQTISYGLLTRVDMRRAYETGQITLDQLVQKLQDRGYTPGDAGTLGNFQRIAAMQVHARRPVANSWVKVGYDASLLKQSLMDQGMREDMWNDVFSALQTRRKIYIQSNCIDGIKRRYLLGVLSDDGVQAQLLSLNMVAADIGQILSDWRCLKRAQPKHETAQQICTEFKAGIIGGDQAARLLRGLGYTAIQARRILALCYLRPAPKGLRHMPRPGSREAAALEEALGT